MEIQTRSELGESSIAPGVNHTHHHPSTQSTAMTASLGNEAILLEEREARRRLETIIVEERVSQQRLEGVLQEDRAARQRIKSMLRDEAVSRVSMVLGRELTSLCTFLSAP